MNLHELVATGACARIGGGDDAHSSRTSRSSRLARALTKHASQQGCMGGGRQVAHGNGTGRSSWVEAVRSPRVQLIQNAQLGRNFPGEENELTSRVCVFCTRKRQQASKALDSARVKAGTVLNFIPAFSYFSTEAITCVVTYVKSTLYYEENKRVKSMATKGLSSTTIARSHRVEPNGPISLLHRQNFGAAPLRGAECETGVSIPTQRGAKQGWPRKKSDPRKTIIWRTCTG
jgi:hypothetical protein